MFAALFTLTSGESMGVGGPLPALGLAVLAFLVGTAYRVAYYYRFAYELTDDELIVASGVFARQQREIPLDRVQNVDVSRPLTTRLLGLAVVQFETAGGSSTEATLDAVSAAEADRLQREASPEARARRRSAGQHDATDPSEDGQEPAAAGASGAGTSDETADRKRLGTEPPADTPLYEIADRELRLLSLVSFRPGAFAVPFIGVPFGGEQLAAFVRRVLTVLGVDLRELAETDPLVLAGLGVGLLGVYLVAVWIVSALLTYVQYYGFRLERRGEELRYERGLLGRYSGTIPLDKVQTVTVGENLVARRLGYAALAVETAGYAPGSNGSGGSETTVPLATRPRVLALAQEVLAASDDTGRYEPAFDRIETPDPSLGVETTADDRSADGKRTPDGERRVDGERMADAARTTESERPVVDPSFTQPEAVAHRWYTRRYLIGVLLLAGVATAVLSQTELPTLYGLVPLIAVPLVPAAARRKWANRGYHETEWALLTREGYWRRRTRIVPSFRLQTVIRTRTIFQRRWGVASVTADTASSASLLGGDATIHDIEPGDSRTVARRLLDRLDQSLRERTAAARRNRKRDGDESTASRQDRDGSRSELDGAGTDEQSQSDEMDHDRSDPDAADSGDVRGNERGTGEE